MGIASLERYGDLETKQIHARVVMDSDLQSLLGDAWLSPTSTVGVKTDKKLVLDKLQAYRDNLHVYRDSLITLASRMNADANNVARPLKKKAVLSDTEKEVLRTAEKIKHDTDIVLDSARTQFDEHEAALDKVVGEIQAEKGDILRDQRGTAKLLRGLRDHLAHRPRYKYEPNLKSLTDLIEGQWGTSFKAYRNAIEGTPAPFIRPREPRSPGVPKTPGHVITPRALHRLEDMSDMIDRKSRNLEAALYFRELMAQEGKARDDEDIKAAIRA